ncbi:MAG: hypothetical protein NWF06_09585 [Candidatus Bathyarchaeota archaeon]|nr:hypothetical protein [Candidatus Bathyarchaeum sp.]
MNSKTKALTVIFVSVVACLLVYSPLTQATQSSISLGDEIAVAEIEECTPECTRVGVRVRFAVWFFRNSEPVEVDGTIVALSDKKLILNTADDQIRVNLPAEWTVDNQVLTREELFTSGYLSEGETVTVNALGADATNNQGVCIYLLVGYELVNESGVKATANLAVNIED